MRVLVLDLETQNHPFYGQVASPHCPDNYVVMDAGEVLEMGHGEVSISPRWERRFTDVDNFQKEWYVPLEGIDMLVAHNAPYEMSWLLKYDYDNFMAFLKRGGRVFCTAYAHYLVSNQTEQYPALNDVAPLYGGTPKVDGIKILWEQGVLTADIDTELLSEYLSGPSGDIENTTKVFLGTWNKLQERGMLKMSMVRMDGMLYSTFCMHHGLKVDMEHASELQGFNEGLVEELQSKVFAMLPEDMPQEAREAFKASRFQLSAFIFGGSMKYPTRVPREKDGKPIYEKAEGPYFDSIKAALPASECVLDDECGGLYYSPALKEHQATYRNGKNKGAPKFAKYETNEVQYKNGDDIYTFPGILTEDVRNKLNEVITNDWAGAQTLPDGSPVISTSGDVLDVLAAHDLPVAKILKNKAAVDKDLGSFYSKVGANGKVSGMLQYVQPDHFIHHTLNHTSTVTGRLSSNKPNLQQLPRAEEAKEGEFKSRVKENFVSRFGSEGVILQEDYSALETVGLQVMTSDSNLKEALLKGLDMHSMRLSAMEGKPYDYVVARTKDESHPDFPVWDRMRTEVKPVAFQYQYGATAFGMAMSTGKSQEFCQAFIDAEQKAFPEVEDWFNNVVFAEVSRTSEANKPIRMQLDSGQYLLVHWGTYTAPSGTTYQFQEQSKRKFNFATKKHEQVKEFRVPQMRNYPIQGESGFFVQLACGMLIRYLIKVNFFSGLCLPINTVHDATYFDCHKSVLREAAIAIEAIMESIPEMLNKLWPQYNCEVPFPVAGGAGPNMAVEDHIYTKEGKEQYMQDKRSFKEHFLVSKGTHAKF